MKNIVLVITIFLCGFLKAQFEDLKDHKGFMFLLNTRIEGTSMGKKTYLSIGTKLPDGKNYYSLRGHFNWRDKKKLLVIPEFDYFRTVISSHDSKDVFDVYMGAGVTPYTVSPKAGFVFLYFLCAELGWNFEYNTFNQLPVKGFRFGLGINAVF